MIFIKCFTTPISKTSQVNITRRDRTTSHSRITKSSFGRLSNMVMTYQMIGECNVVPNYDEVGWSATINNDLV